MYRHEYCFSGVVYLEEDTLHLDCEHFETIKWKSQ